MDYNIGPLDSIVDFKHYFYSRYTLNKQFFPQEDSYYRNRYELDYYDLFSHHYGLSKRGEDRIIGFLRITPNILTGSSRKMEKKPEVVEFIMRAIKELNLPKPTSSLPSIQQFENSNKALFKKLRNKKGFAELGRLIIMENSFPATLPLSLISYGLAASIFQRINFMLIRTSEKHAKFYHRYYSSLYMAKRKDDELFIPSIYKLDTLSEKSSKVITDILAQFEERKQISPISFYKNPVVGKKILNK